MVNTRLLSTTSAQDGHAFLMDALEDLHHRLGEISAGRFGKPDRPHEYHYEWAKANHGILTISPEDPDDFRIFNRTILIEWDNASGDNTDNVTVVLPDHPIPLFHASDKDIHAWICEVAKNLRLVIDAFGRRPVILNDASVEKCAYDAALAIASDIHERISPIRPSYAKRNPTWTVEFPLPWAEGSIQNHRAEIPFAEIFSDPIALAVISTSSSASRVLQVSRFALKRDGSELTDPLDRLAAHGGLGALSAFCSAKGVARK